MLKKSEKLLTPAQAGELLGVSPITIRYWANEGRIKFITTQGGHRRFEQAEINRLLKREPIVKAKETIVIVEDDQQYADLLVEFISVLYPQFDIKVAYSGFEAGSMIANVKPFLIFLDIVMPDIDGFAVCKHIRANNLTKNTPIIAMSGLSEQESIDNIILAGANEFLQKPIRLSVLKESVDALIQTHASKK
ncbi:MAG: response regulator [Colwellia sp.]